MQSIRTLIVEDDLRIAELHRRFTEKVGGFEVVGIATSLSEAEEMVSVLEPELILLDLYFPEGNGLELLQRLRGSGSQVDVILITAARELASLQAALRGGVFDYIIKPVLFPRFQDALGKFFDYRQRMASGGVLEQKDVDRLLHPAGSAEAERQLLPKGIDPLTLKKVRAIFASPVADGLCAEDVGEQLGVSRSTARRYLEYLVTEDVLRADLIYGTVGRPERRYFSKSQRS